MNASAELTLFRAPHFGCIRIVGRANFAASPGFKRAMDELIEERPARLVMDLDQCQLMDSTFLGVLSGGAERYHEEIPGQLRIELANANGRVTGLIDSLGVSKWFRHVTGELELPTDVKAQRLALDNTTKLELKETSLAAHERLGQQNELNRIKFAEITRNLREDLDKLRAGQAPMLPGFDMAAINRQAGEVGGDFYDFAPLSGLRVAVLIADVCGKGTSAAQVAAQVRPFLRDELARDRSPGHVFQAALSLAPTLPENMFVTAMCLVVNAVSHSFRLARAGHDPLLWFHAPTGKVEALQPKGMALGIERTGLEEATFTEREFPISPGDIILLHTDGIAESLSPGGEEFGCERLKALLTESASLDAKGIAENVFMVIDAFTHGAPAHDDRTIVVIKAL
jgi:serine phosphatase RsbU (regulator of sigma subunit)/anti-anti-sigma regulatory factor